MRAIPDEYRECNAVSNVQNAFSVWGEEFVNFIAATLTCRILRRAEKAKLLDKMTFGEMLEDLEQSWRPVKDAEINAIPDSTDGKWVNTTIGTMEMLSALGLVKSPDKPEHKKPGRPRKQKLEFVGPKRPRGRPRKVTPSYTGRQLCCDACLSGYSSTRWETFSHGSSFIKTIIIDFVFFSIFSGSQFYQPPTEGTCP